VFEALGSGGRESEAPAPYIGGGGEIPFIIPPAEYVNLDDEDPKKRASAMYLKRTDLCQCVRFFFDRASFFVGVVCF
jgi:hypothetical protein